VLFMRSDVRNGAEAWMRQLLDMAGLGGYFLLPLLTVALLLAWHHMTRRTWSVRRRVLLGMVVEAALFGVVLVGVARFYGHFFVMSIHPTMAATSSPHPLATTLARIAGFCGAGIYEEVLFRLLLIPTIVAILQAGKLRPAACYTTAFLLSSIIFSAAHYVGSAADSWALASFLFRLVAGVYFALLFVLRGFGIAAGAHALYDVCVGIDW